MGLLQDFKDLGWIKSSLIITLAAAAVGGGAYVRSQFTSKPLEQVATEGAKQSDIWKHSLAADGKHTYTFETGDEPATYTFSTQKAFEQFNVLANKYTVEHEKELNGREYLTPAEGLAFAKLVDDKKYLDGIKVITESEMESAFNTYKLAKDSFKIEFDTAPAQPGKAFNLMNAAEAEYDKIVAAQDRELQIYRERKGLAQQKWGMLRQAADQQYRQELRSDAGYQRAKAEFQNSKYQRR